MEMSLQLCCGSSGLFSSESPLLASGALCVIWDVHHLGVQAEVGSPALGEGGAEESGNSPSLGSRAIVSRGSS